MTNLDYGGSIKDEQLTFTSSQIEKKIFKVHKFYLDNERRKTNSEFYCRQITK